MFAINLKSAEGKNLPYLLVLRPWDHNRVQMQVVDGDRILSKAMVAYDRMPLNPRSPDIRVGNMGFGYEPLHARLLVEFGDDPRLGVVPASEVRSALNVCRCYDSVMKY